MTSVLIRKGNLIWTHRETPGVLTQSERPYVYIGKSKVERPQKKPNPLTP